MTDVLDRTALEEMRAFNTALEAKLATLQPAHMVPPEVTRLARREGRSIFPAPVFLPAARDVQIPGRGGPIRLRVIAPVEGAPVGVYLHLHGGGFVLGAADEQDVLLQELADASGLVVASVDYRLAPEHPFPAGPDDCEDAALWLLGEGCTQLGAPPRRTIGGESAGAHLAALTLLRLRDLHGRADAFSGANLVFGPYDVGMTPSQRRWGDRYLVLNTPLMRWFYDCFLPGMDIEKRRDPSISPLYADLSGMPPALFTVGTLDPLLDDSLFMEARWRTAGGVTELHVVPEAIHGFTAYPLEAARAARRTAAGFVRSVVAV
jgi:acetyl esterase